MDQKWHPVAQWDVGDTWKGLEIKLLFFKLEKAEVKKVNKD